jgi:hypothetical protein
VQSKPAGLFVRRVFISYSRADIRHVWAIASALRHEGVETWLDFEDLKPGERWKDAIEAALARADLMLFCVSPNSVESAWTSVELKLALENAVPILPLIVHRVAIEALPPALRDIQVLEMERWPAEHAPWHVAQQVLAVLGLQRRTERRPSDDPAYHRLWISLGQRRLQPAEVGMASDRARVRHVHVRRLTDTVLAELMSSSARSQSAVITTDGSACETELYSLMGAVAARVGEWRLTLVDLAPTPGANRCATLCRAHYMPVPSPHAGSGEPEPTQIGAGAAGC